MLKALAASALALALLTTAAAAADNWVRLGSVSFSDPFLTTDVKLPFDVNGVTSVRFVVTGADVEIANIRLTYGNGQSEDIAVRSVFKAGSASREVPLPGVSGRTVKRVSVTYRAHGEARFDILGNLAPNKPANWLPLGCKTVGFAVDRDAIAVGVQQGGFTALRLNVRNAPVEFYDGMVTFGNGQQQKLPIRATVAPGSMSRQLDLAGQVRGIKRIDFLYRSIPTFKGQAVVCADGLASP